MMTCAGSGPRWTGPCCRCWTRTGHTATTWGCSATVSRTTSPAWASVTSSSILPWLNIFYKAWVYLLCELVLDRFQFAALYNLYNLQEFQVWLLLNNVDTRESKDPIGSINNCKYFIIWKTPNVHFFILWWYFYIIFLDIELNHLIIKYIQTS